MNLNEMFCKLNESLNKFVDKIKKDNEYSNFVSADNLYIGKIYSLVHKATDINQSNSFGSISNSYALLIKKNNKYYIVPNSVFPSSMKISDVRELSEEHELFVQSDNFSRFKPFTYYAPSAKGKLISPEELKKYSEFVGQYIIRGQHQRRKDLDLLVRGPISKNIETKTNSNQQNNDRGLDL